MAAVALLAAPTSAIQAQTFSGYVSGDSVVPYPISGMAVVCNTPERTFLVLTDSVSGRAVSFLFHRPPEPTRSEYALDGAGQADVFAAYFSGRGNHSEDWDAAGKITITAGGPRGMAGSFELGARSRTGAEHAVVTGEFSARALGYMRPGELCSRKVKVARVATFGWPAAVTEAVLEGEVQPGMTAEMAREAWGEPLRVESTRTAAAATEVWHYLNAELTLRNGVVVMIRE